MDQDQQAHLEHHRHIHQRNLARLETQAAQYGALRVPTLLSNEIDAERDAIAEIEAILSPTTGASSTRSVTNYPSPPASSPSSISSAILLNDRNTEPPLDEVVFVDVNRDEAGPGLKRWVGHGALLVQSVEPRGADLWAERITHRYEPGQVMLVISDARIRRGAK
jgi:hypothetical protein